MCGTQRCPRVSQRQKAGLAWLLCPSPQFATVQLLYSSYSPQSFSVPISPLPLSCCLVRPMHPTYLASRLLSAHCVRPAQCVRQVVAASSSFHSSSLSCFAKKKLRRDWTVPKGRESLKDAFGNDTAYAAPISNEKKKLRESLFGSYTPDDMSLKSSQERPAAYRKPSYDAGAVPSPPPVSVNPSSSSSSSQSSSSRRGESVRQLRMSRQLSSALDDVLSSSSVLSTGLLSFCGVPLDVVDVSVSPDLRHATVLWDLPYNVPDGQEHAVGKEIERRIGEGGGGKLAEIYIANRVKAQYSVRVRFVRAVEREVVKGGGVTMMDVDDMFDIIERDLRGTQEEDGQEAFDKLEDVEPMAVNSPLTRMKEEEGR